MQVRVRFVKPWQGYEVGNDAQFHSGIGKHLISEGLVKEVPEGERFAPLSMPFAARAAAGEILASEAGPDARGSGLFEE